MSYGFTPQWRKSIWPLHVYIPGWPTNCTKLSWRRGFVNTIFSPRHILTNSRSFHESIIVVNPNRFASSGPTLPFPTGSTLSLSLSRQLQSPSGFTCYCDCRSWPQGKITSKRVLSLPFPCLLTVNKKCIGALVLILQIFWITFHQF